MFRAPKPGITEEMASSKPGIPPLSKSGLPRISGKFQYKFVGRAGFAGSSGTEVGLIPGVSSEIFSFA
jgi:hypothetical protein